MLIVSDFTEINNGYNGSINLQCIDSTGAITGKSMIIFYVYSFNVVDNR